MYDVVTVILQCFGESDISRRMYQYRISLRTKGMECACHTAENTVFVTYMLLFKPGHVILPFLPLNNLVVIFLRCCKVTISRMLCPLDDCLRDCRHRCKVHVCDPHRDTIKPIPYFYLFPYAKGIRKDINGKGIFAFSVNNRGKIVFHSNLLCLFFISVYS